jgi:hypothetical protein
MLRRRSGETTRKYGRQRVFGYATSKERAETILGNVKSIKKGHGATPAHAYSSNKAADASPGTSAECGTVNAGGTNTWRYHCCCYTVCGWETKFCACQGGVCYWVVKAGSVDTILLCNNTHDIHITSIISF